MGTSCNAYTEGSGTTTEYVCERTSSNVAQGKSYVLAVTTGTGYAAEYSFPDLDENGVGVTAGTTSGNQTLYDNGVSLTNGNPAGSPIYGSGVAVAVSKGMMSAPSITVDLGGAGTIDKIRVLVGNALDAIPYSAKAYTSTDGGASFKRFGGYLEPYYSDETVPRTASVPGLTGTYAQSEVYEPPQTGTGYSISKSTHSTLTQSIWITFTPLNGAPTGVTHVRVDLGGTRFWTMMGQIQVFKE